MLIIKIYLSTNRLQSLKTSLKRTYFDKFEFCEFELQAEQHFDEAEDHLLGGGCRGVCQGNPRMSLPLKIHT
jgi:hypothetical protein